MNTRELIAMRSDQGLCIFSKFSVEALGGSGYFLSLYILSLFSHNWGFLFSVLNYFKNYLNNIIY